MLNLFTALIAAYHKISAADEYWFGFVLNHTLYVVPHMTFETLSRFFKQDRASSKRGGFLKVRIRARVDELAELLPGAIELGSETLLKKANKGDALEEVLLNRFAGCEWVKNDTPFWIAGDMVIDGRQVQVKFNGAELTNEKLFKNNFPEMILA